MQTLSVQIAYFTNQQSFLFIGIPEFSDKFAANALSLISNTVISFHHKEITGK